MTKPLSDYYAKRDFKKTAEPRGKVGARATKQRKFVVQRHAATRLHFDLRLEHKGVYRSWAVTKVPSSDPATRRLAVEVEDHPLDYGTFEGTIPKGEYGGGTVQLWDKGTWAPQDDADVEAALKKGHLKFTLKGERMEGNWALIRLKDEEAKRGRKLRHNWLLIKEKDEFATPGKEDALAKNVTSIKTGRTLEEIAGGKKSKTIKTKSKKAAPKSKTKAKSLGVPVARRTKSVMPDFVEPQLCRLTDAPPGGAGWVHEVKFDGYRTQARVEKGKAKLITRKGLDWTHRFPEIAKECGALPDCLIDGEICALDRNGMTDFGGLQTALSDKKTGGLIFFLFDCLFADGVDMRTQPLSARKDILQRLLKTHAGKSKRLRFAPHFAATGEAVLDAACRMELEGVVSKKLDAPYTSGRADSWTKAKCRGGQEVVVLGWRGDAKTLRSLVVGTHDNGQLVYRGRVGTGYTQKLAADVLSKLKPLQRKTPAAQGAPRARDLNWVEPKIVAEIQYENVTGDGLFRQAAFKGLRLDKPAQDIVLEQARRTQKARPREEDPVTRKKAAVRTIKTGSIKTGSIKTGSIKTGGRAEVGGISISHPDKALWPAEGKSEAVNKLDLARYYEAVADKMLPHIAQRPITVVRAPDGIKGELFYQRHKLIGTAAPMQPIKAKGEKEPFLALDNAQSLVALAQAGVVEIHPWGAPKGDPEKAERIIMDLDPSPEVPFTRVVEAAKQLRKFLSDLGLTPFVKTTGGKGLHVVIAVKPVDWSEAKTFAKNVALALAAAAPGQYTTSVSKKDRVGKIFVDYLRNDRTATGVAPYSPRARDGAPVAMPLEWREVTAKLDPKSFSISTLAKWLKRKDAWKDIGKSAKALAPAAKKLAAMV